MPKPKTESLKDYRPQSKNANKHTQRGLSMLEKSIQEGGFIGAMTSAADGEIFDGSARLETVGHALPVDPIVIESDGTRPIIVKRTDIPNADDPKAKRLALMANRTAQVDLEWDAEILKGLEEEIKIDDLFTENEMLDIGIHDVTDPQEDDVPAVPTQAKSVLGDLYELGRHRVLCGDSTNSDDVAKLMDGKKADMVFTDPPYGVNYEGGHFHSGNVNIVRKREKIADDDDAVIYSEFLPAVLPFVDGAFYMWFADSKAYDVYKALMDNDCETHALIIWNKTNATYAAMNAQYKQRHEPMVYFKPKGKTLRWCGKSDECTVWDEKRDGVNEYHPTQKPVCLAIRAITNHEAVTVADFFLGSGTTLIAAEQTNRTCYGMELEPRYLDVIVSRYCKFTGNNKIIRNGSEIIWEM